MTSDTAHPDDNAAPTDPFGTTDPAGATAPVQLAESPPPSPYAPPLAPSVTPVEAEQRDRVWIHFAWEGILVVLLAGGIGLWWLFGGDTNLLRDPALLGHRMYQVAPFLLLATALAVSIRARAVNLSVGAVAALVAWLLVEWEGSGALVAAGIAVTAVIAAGVVLSVLVTLLRIPGWAASLGVVVAVMVTMITILDEAPVFSVGGTLSSPPDLATVRVGEELVWVVVGAVMAVSVLGGVVGVFPSVRRRLAACRAAAAESGPRHRSAALTTGAALLVSSLLAGAAGALLVIPAESEFAAVRIHPGVFEPLGIAIALAIVLLGGTSLWGRRGGVFGTVLAALAMFAVFIAFDEQGWFEASFWITVGAVALGFVISWLIELLGVRSPRPVNATAAPTSPAAWASPAPSSDPAGTGYPAAPADPAAPAPGTPTVPASAAAEPTQASSAPTTSTAAAAAPPPPAAAAGSPASSASATATVSPRSPAPTAWPPEPDSESESAVGTAAVPTASKPRSGS